MRSGFGWSCADRRSQCRAESICGPRLLPCSSDIEQPELPADLALPPYRKCFASSLRLRIVLGKGVSRSAARRSAERLCGTQKSSSRTQPPPFSSKVIPCLLSQTCPGQTRDQLLPVPICVRAAYLFCFGLLST